MATQISNMQVTLSDKALAVRELLNALQQVEQEQLGYAKEISRLIEIQLVLSAKSAKLHETIERLVK